MEGGHCPKDTGPIHEQALEWRPSAQLAPEPELLVGEGLLLVLLTFPVSGASFRTQTGVEGANGPYLVRVSKLELPSIPCPADKRLTGFVREQLQKELPQLDGSASWG